MQLKWKFKKKLFGYIPVICFEFFLCKKEDFFCLERKRNILLEKNWSYF